MKKQKNNKLKNLIIGIDDFRMIVDAVDYKLGVLYKLEREIFNCMDKEFKGVVVADNLRNYYRKLEEARKKIWELFNTQYPNK